jgi:uncharacterized protein YaiL (DUF2058 family)
MSSLRDLLVAKGLASEKRAKEVAREVRDERKQQQAERKKKSVEEREADEQARLERERQLEVQRVAREAARVEREAREHVLRVRQIVQANRQAGRGPVPFYHRRGDGPVLGQMSLPVATARDLRVGRAAIVGITDDLGRWTYHVVSAKAVEKLRELAPEVLLHDVRDLEHLSDPAQALSPRDWPGELGPRRVRDRQELPALLAREAHREERRDQGRRSSVT